MKNIVLIALAAVFILSSTVGIAKAQTSDAQKVNNITHYLGMLSQFAGVCKGNQADANITATCSKVNDDFTGLYDNFLSQFIKTHQSQISSVLFGPTVSSTIQRNGLGPVG